jgi:hypothetical protein
MAEQMIQQRSYGPVRVDVLCRCEGCARLGGVTVVYQGVSSIARLADLSKVEEK